MYSSIYSVCISSTSYAQISISVCMSVVCLCVCVCVHRHTIILLKLFFFNSVYKHALHNFLTFAQVHFFFILFKLNRNILINNTNNMHVKKKKNGDYLKLLNTPKASAEGKKKRVENACFSSILPAICLVLILKKI